MEAQITKLQNENDILKTTYDLQTNAQQKKNQQVATADCLCSNENKRVAAAHKMLANIALMSGEDILSIRQRHLDTITILNDRLQIKDQNIASTHEQMHNLIIDRLKRFKQRQQLNLPEYAGSPESPRTTNANSPDTDATSTRQSIDKTELIDNLHVLIREKDSQLLALTAKLNMHENKYAGDVKRLHMAYKIKIKKILKNSNTRVASMTAINNIAQEGFKNVCKISTKLMKKR